MNLVIHSAKRGVDVEASMTMLWTAEVLTDVNTNMVNYWSASCLHSNAIEATRRLKKVRHNRSYSRWPMFVMLQ